MKEKIRNKQKRSKERKIEERKKEGGGKKEVECTKKHL